MIKNIINYLYKISLTSMSQNYYNNNAQSFIENTINADMKKQYDFFEKYLSSKGKLLDVGFGSGRDSLYFSKKYEVVSIDNCQSFIDEGKKILNNKILLMDVKDISYKDEFDGIWACATLLHIPFYELPDVLNRCFNALKDNGVMYMSFKYGDYEGMRNGRYFTDLNEDRLNKLISKSSFKILDIMITEDVRPNRDEKWLNIVLKK